MKSELFDVQSWHFFSSLILFKDKIVKDLIPSRINLALSGELLVKELAEISEEISEETPEEIPSETPAETPRELPAESSELEFRGGFPFGLKVQEVRDLLGRLPGLLLVFSGH